MSEEDIEQRSNKVDERVDDIFKDLVSDKKKL